MGTGMMVQVEATRPRRRKTKRIPIIMDMMDLYGQIIDNINEIDIELDSLTGGNSAGKRKVTTNLEEKHASVYEGPLNQTLEFISGQSEEIQAAVVSAFMDGLRGKFGKSTDSYISAIVDNQPTQEALITEEEAALKSSQRSDLYQKAKSIVQLLESVGEEVEMPKARRGSSGKRGPRNLSLFTFSINGEDVDMTVAQLAEAGGYSKAAELTKALRDPNESSNWKGFDTKDGAQFDDFSMPNGKVLSGFRDDSEASDEDDDDIYSGD
jgi:hypothetical protein